jgi:cell division protein FtsZ
MTSVAFKFDIPTHHKSIIKVIGVGGGGSNAVNHMYNQGIKDVEFVICNTDAQALKSSPVPSKLQIGLNLTSGLGAGANPERGRNAAIESREDIRELLGDNTKMVFITAGMGGGTGTGAAPVIAKIAKELDILTVGIVTSPFNFEGKKKRQQADVGIAELRENCDTVLVISNDKLREIYGNLSIREAFAQADNVLTTAAKSIAEIITVTSDVNVDFEDVKTVMKDSGAAVMGSAITNGDGRARRAAEEALSSPLLNNTDIHGAEKILLSITSGEEAELRMDELTEITDYIEEKAGDNAEVIFGQGIDAALKENIRVTVIATGFQQKETYDYAKKTIFDLESDKQFRLFEEQKNNASAKKDTALSEGKTLFSLDGPREEKKTFEFEVKPSVKSSLSAEQRNEDIKEENKVYLQMENVSDSADENKQLLMEQAKERLKRLKGISNNLNMSPDEFKEKLEVPAYLRKKINLADYPHSSEKNISRYNLNDDNEILGNNKFLHDNVD